MTQLFTKACVVLLIFSNTVAFAGQKPSKKKKSRPARANCLNVDQVGESLAIVEGAVMFGVFTRAEGAEEIRKIKRNACKNLHLSSVYDGNADKHYVNSNPETPASSDESTSVGSRAS